MSIGDFARRNWKLILVITVILSLASAALLAVLPQQYSRQLTLGVRTVPIGLSDELAQPTINLSEVGNSAVSYLQETDIEGVTVIPTYNLATQQVDVTLQAQSRAALEGASGSRIEDLLEERFRGTYEELLVATLGARLTDLRLQIQAEKEALGLLERNLGGAQGARLRGLEAERARAQAEIARLETEAGRLEQVRDDPSELETSPIAVSTVSETEIVQSRSFLPMVVLAVMLSLIVAVATAVVRTVLAGSKR